MVLENPYRRQTLTLEQVKNDPKFAKGWYAKQTDEIGSFVLPLRFYFHQIGENDPIMHIKRTAFFNEHDNVILLVQTGYTDRPVITLMYETEVLEYLKDSKDIH